MQWLNDTLNDWLIAIRILDEGFGEKNGVAASEWISQLIFDWF